ncbi:MAG: glycosyltransferase family 2 protein, partial [Myxococcales bacterium]|nr:glycosyltransferase family 2 protein [Myxococcales bacterium]
MGGELGQAVPRELSVVVPARDEAPNLRPLYDELSEVAAREGLALEIIFIDDGSADATWSVIAGLCAEDARVRGVRLRRNFGKSAALAAGFDAASAPLVLTIDGDGQDDPAEIPAMLSKLDEGFDVVSGWKRERNDPGGRVAASRLFNFMVRRLSDLRLHDFNCGLKLMRREVAAEIDLYGELHRFIPVMAHSQGFRVCEVAVNHRPRRAGESKFTGAGRGLRGALDLLVVKFLTSYRGRPQHALGVAGALAFGLGALIMAYLAVTWVVRLWSPQAFLPLSDRPLLIYGIAALIIGAQMISLGFVAALITSYHARGRPTYRVLERAGAHDAAQDDHRGGCAGRDGERDGVASKARDDRAGGG